MSVTEQQANELLNDDDEGLPIEGEIIEETIADKPKPVGYMDYDAWIADGRDPEKFRGRKAFDDYGDSINTIKELKGQFGKFDETINTLKNQYQADADQKIEAARVEARQELEQARTDEDIPAFEAAKDKIAALDKPKPANSQQHLNPSLSNFMENNPIINESSPQYNLALHQEWYKIYSSSLDSFIGGNRERHEELTQDEIDKSMKFAMRRIKELNPDNFVSPKNKRPAATTTTTTTKRTSSTPDYATRLKAMVTNGMNKNDRTATLDMYNILKKTDQAAADAYAKNILGD